MWYLIVLILDLCTLTSFDLDLGCLSKPFWHATSVQNFTSIVKSSKANNKFSPSGLTSMGISLPPPSSRKNDGYRVVFSCGLEKCFGESIDSDRENLLGLELSLPGKKI